MHHQYQKKEERSIWQIDDSIYFNKKEKERFNDERSTIVEATLEQWGAGCFDNIRVEDYPFELTRFINNFLSMFGVKQSHITKTEDFILQALHYIDYMQPYYCLVDTPVHLTKNHLDKTYKTKSTGETFDPNRIEIFRYNPDHDYKHYNLVKSLFDHEMTKKILRGERVFSQNLNRDMTKKDIYEKIVTIIYGNLNWYEDTVMEMFENYFEGEMYSLSPGATEAMRCAEIEAAARNDRQAWRLAILACFIWFKSPEALEFFIEYHPVYGSIFDYNRKSGKYEIADGSGGQILVDGVNIYTMRDVISYDAVPGTCEACGVSVHCTQLLNLNAIVNPTCSCGERIDPFHIDPWNSYDAVHRSHLCKPYKEKFPIRSGFVCQHCLYTKINGLPQEVKCGKAVCPNVQCPHHMGELARLRALTEMRTRQLTAPARN